jgi:hypothetical protein
MAHRRAVPRSHPWARWLVVPLALILDAVAAVRLAGTPFPMGVLVPELVLFAAPLLVYGALAALVLRARPLGARLAAAAALLGIHVGLVLLHTAGYVVLWSLPAQAAIRLAHRWSPLIPLLQLVWVPLLALPLLTLTRRPPAPVARRAVATPSRRDVQASRSPHPAARPRVEPSREVHVDPGAALPGLATVRPSDLAAAPPPTVIETPPAAEREPAPAVPAVPTVPLVPPTVTLEASLLAAPPASPATTATVAPDVAEPGTPPPPVPVADGERRALAPAPGWFDELAAPRSAEPDPIAAPDDHVAPPPAPMPLAPPAPVETVALALPVVPVAAEPIADVKRPTRDTREDEPARATDAAPVTEPAVPAVPAAPAPRGATAPPVDPYLVARLFEPYGPLLSRDRTVLVDWTPGPDAGVLCAAPRGAFRDEVVRLAARLARILDGGGAAWEPGPVRRLSLRVPDGVVVLTALDGAVLAAAARRAGALALLEVLSARVAPGPIRGTDDPGSEPAAPASLDVELSGATRVETPSAILEVFAPAGVDAAALGELAGRTLAAIPAAGDRLVLDSLCIDVGAHRLMVHPVHPDARPPRFVAVVGGPERAGLLGRRTARAARAIREAS